MKQEGELFDYQSTRAKKARTARRIAHKDIYWLLLICGWALLAVGAVIVWYSEMPIGWLIAGFSGAFWMAAAWSHDLQDIPPSTSGGLIDSTLDADLLGLLPQQHSPQQLAGLVLHTNGGLFLVARFGLHNDF